MAGVIDTDISKPRRMPARDLALIASFAALTSGQRGARWAALAGLFYAAMLRHNAIVAIAPMLVLVGPWPAHGTRWLRRLVGIAIACPIA